MKFYAFAVTLALTAVPNVSLAAPRNEMLHRQALAFERAAESEFDVQHSNLVARQEERYKPTMDKKKYDEYTRDYGVGGWCRDYKHGKGSDAVEGWEMCVDYCKKKHPDVELVNGQRPNPNCGMAFVPMEQVEAYEKSIQEIVDHQGYKWRQLPCDCDMADVAKVVSAFANIILPALGEALCGLMEELYEGTMKALDIGLTVVDIASTFIPGPGTLVKIGSKAMQIGVKAAKTLDKAASAGDKASGALEFANWFGGGCGAEKHKPSMQDIQDKFFPALLKVPDELAAPCIKGKCRDSDKDGNPDFPEGTPEHIPNPPDKPKPSSKAADKTTSSKTSSKPSSSTTKHASSTTPKSSSTTKHTSSTTSKPTNPSSGRTTTRPVSTSSRNSTTKATGYGISKTTSKSSAISITSMTAHSTSTPYIQSTTTRTNTTQEPDEEEDPLMIPVPISVNATTLMPSTLSTTSLTPTVWYSEPVY